MNTLIAIVLCIVGGMGNGSYLLPLKYQKRWEWEHTYGVGVVWMYLIFPWATAYFTVPELIDVFRKAGASNVGLTFFWGLVFGTGSLTFAIGVRLLGLALGYAVMLGMIVVFATTIPLFVQHADQAGTIGGITLLAGVGLFLISVIVCAVAGRQREREKGISAGGSSEDQKRVNYLWAFVVAVYAAFGCAAFYFAQAFADKIKASAVAHGASASAGPDAVFCIQLLGGLIPNTIYVLVQLTRKRAWATFWRRPARSALREHALALLLGFLWYYSVWLYGRAYTLMGEIGISAGAAIFMAFILLTGSSLGFLTGEWRGTKTRTRKIMFFGLSFLVLAVAVVGWGNYLSTRPG